jgi:fatty-acyl-CoA synthase
MSAATILGRLARALADHPDQECLAVWSAGRAERRTVADLLGSAAAVAQWLGDAGVRPGNPVPIMRPAGFTAASEFLGCIMFGALPCLLAPPNPRMSSEAFASRLRGVLGRVDAGVLLMGEAGADLARLSTGLRVADPQGLAARDPLPWLGRLCDPGDPAFLQHSSGTTGVPKAVLIGHGQLVSHLDAYGACLAVGPDDRIASWLPWYHDMGLIACFWGALLWDIPLVQLDNIAWANEPALLFDAIRAERPTLVWQPNFAFAHLERTVTPARFAELDLSCVRAWTNCSEPLRAETMDRFLARFAGHGVRSEALLGCYAMAENVFAVTASAAPATVLACDRDRLERDGVVAPAVAGAPSTRLLSSGRVMAGVEIAIAGAVDAGRVGEILVRGPWRLPSYWREPADPQVIDADGWLHTGDLGVLVDGELYVIGRAKDMIIVAGRNCIPSEIEAAAGQVADVLPGRVCCIGLPSADGSTEELHLIAETALPAGDHAALSVRLRTAVSGETQFPIRRAWIVPPRWLVKSSSGKLSRVENRRRLLREFAVDGRPAG